MISYVFILSPHFRANGNILFSNQIGNEPKKDIDYESYGGSIGGGCFFRWFFFHSFSILEDA